MIKKRNETIIEVENGNEFDLSSGSVAVFESAWGILKVNALTVDIDNREDKEFETVDDLIHFLNVVTKAAYVGVE